MADLLFEIFSEEIPARMQRPAATWWRETLEAKLREARLEHGELRVLVGPRRLGVIVRDLPAMQPDITIERKGPKVGAPDQAMQGFLKSTGLQVDQLEIRNLGKEECYYAVQQQKGQPAADALKAILESLLGSYTWPKSMRWGAHALQWVRPLHHLLCLFDGKVLPVTFHHLEANAITFGHRFLAPAELRIDRAEVYESVLERAKVLACADRRRVAILAQARALAAEKNLTLKEDAGLIDEVTGLVEWPVLLVGTIDAVFMDLPPEVLVMVMKNHQKYLALYEADGTLSPHFLIVSNMETEDKGAAIVAGNERVLRARFADARFFWDQDRKRALGDWAKDLASVTYHAKIGTVAEKVERIAMLATAIATALNIDPAPVEQAARLAKADLVTGMVGEFAELQGLMGRYYALSQNEASEVADAIRDHYLPLGPDSPVPTAPVSICVALAEKLDTLISMFAIGEKPTGSKDPFALRRAGLGVIRIILENCLSLPLLKLPHITQEIIDFLNDRLAVRLRDQRKQHDWVKAVLAVSSDEDDLMRTVAKVEALTGFLTAEDGKSLLAAYKRAANILAIEEKKDKKTFNSMPIRGSLAAPEAEALFDALESQSEALAEAVAQGRFVEAMQNLAALRVPIDQFFDHVLVNDKDVTIRENRLKLLAMFTRKAGIIANFSLIEG